MKTFSSSLAAVCMGWTSMVASGCGGPAESSGTTVAEDTNTATTALTAACPTSDACQINADGTAFCAPTAITTVSSRNVYYRIGATTGPGYNAATGSHAAVVLFQGTTVDQNTNAVDDGGGGSNGPRATWCMAIPKPGDFGVWYQVATVVALVDAGYTVIQPAAALHRGFGYFWDTNIGLIFDRFPGSADDTLTKALITQLQAGVSTFGAIDIHHVYATGISSGGYMSSRVANDFAGGINGNSTVKMTSKPFRAVAIESGSFKTCSGERCTVPQSLPSAHAPTFFLHDEGDMVVPFSTMETYRGRLNTQFPNSNPAYTVNGVRETFTMLDSFPGGVAPKPHHEWDSNLTADSDNLILQWFSSHR